MANDVVNNLRLYLRELLDRRSGAIPAKHSHRVKEFHQFLDNEIKMTKAKIESLTLSDNLGKTK